MYTESLICGAFAAGFVEGASILWNDKLQSSAAGVGGRNENDGSTEVNEDSRSGLSSSPQPNLLASLPGLLAPSALYGAMAVPLSFVGSSPGSSIVSTLGKMTFSVHFPSMTRNSSTVASATPPYSTSWSSHVLRDSSPLTSEGTGSRERDASSSSSSLDTAVATATATATPDSSEADKADTAEAEPSVRVIRRMKLPLLKAQTTSTATATATATASSSLDNPTDKVETDEAQQTTNDGKNEGDSSSSDTVHQDSADSSYSLSPSPSNAIAIRLREDNRRAVAAMRAARQEQHKKRQRQTPPRDDTNTSVNPQYRYGPPSTNNNDTSLSLPDRHFRIGAPTNTSSLPHASTPNTLRQQHSTIQKYLATLDGKPLPTTLAEIMRRARVGLVGLAIVSALITQHVTLTEQRTKQTEKKWRDKLDGKDVDAVRAYVEAVGGSTSDTETVGHGSKAVNGNKGGDGNNGQKHGGGIAIRLVGNDYSGMERSMFLGEKKTMTLPWAEHGDNDTKDGQHIYHVAVRTLPIVCHDVESDPSGNVAWRRAFLSRYVGSISNQQEKNQLFNDWAYWDSGRTIDEWKETPIDSDWLFHPRASGISRGLDDFNTEATDIVLDPPSTGRLDQVHSVDDSNIIVSPIFLIEADVSESFRFTLQSSHRRTVFAYPMNLTIPKDNTSSHVQKPMITQGRLTLDRAKLMSNTLCMVARERGLVRSKKGTHASAINNKIATHCVNVFIGAKRDFAESTSNANDVYIDGLAAIECAVADLAEKLYSQSKDVRDSPTLIQQTTFSKSTTEDGIFEGTNKSSSEVRSLNKPNDRIDMLTLLEIVGKKIRQGCQMTVDAVTSAINDISIASWQPSDSKVLHVVTDDTNIVRWLGNALSSKRWRVVGHHSALVESMNLPDSTDEIPNESLVFVCCSDDDKTCNAMCSLLSSRPDLANRNVFSLVEHKSSQKTLNTLMEEFARHNEQIKEAPSLSVADIHNEMFGYVRHLFLMGKSPAEVQSILDSKMTFIAKQ